MAAFDEGSAREITPIENRDPAAPSAAFVGIPTEDADHRISIKPEGGKTQAQLSLRQGAYWRLSLQAD